MTERRVELVLMPAIGPAYVVRATVRNEMQAVLALHLAAMMDGATPIRWRWL